MVRFRFLVSFLFSGIFLQAQDNRFLNWPFLRSICTIDTNCTHYFNDHIAITTDSIFNGTSLRSIETRKYDAKGRLISVSSIRKDTVNAPTELLSYGLDAQGMVVKATISSITGKDTTEFYKGDILKYDKQYRPALEHYHTAPSSTASVEKQFIDDRLIFKYSGTQACIHWYNAYCTDNFVRSSYDKPNYGWVQEQVCLHEKDTLYRRINYFNMKYIPVRCETFIWANDSTKTETVVDSLFNITETITWTHGKISEHHFYTTQYAGKTIYKMTVFNGMVVPQQRQFVIEYFPTETVVTPENGEPIHLEKSLEIEDTPPPPPPMGNPFTYKTRKMEGTLARYDCYNFHLSTAPLLTMWFDKGVMVKSVSGDITTKRSYTYR